jgi:hypothetical protein
MTTYPICFKSPKQFREWAYLAMQAREEATPCGDCTKDYQERMLRECRCLENEVKEVFKYLPKTYRFKKESETV